MKSASRGFGPTMNRAGGGRPTAGAPVTVEAPASGTRERIQQRAYEIYLSRKGAPGDPVADWLQAEGEFRAGASRHGTASQKPGASSERGEILMHDDE